MDCSVRETQLPKRDSVAVNGVPISRNLIAREIQNHPAPSPVKAWTAAARALVVRELLLQRARQIGVTANPLDDGEGRCETEEEALIRAVVEQEVSVPAADIEACRRYYDQNRRRFRSPDIYEVSHILIPATQTDAEGRGLARSQATDLITQLQKEPGQFADLARLHSACPSAQQGGNLGQISTGQTTPEFENALKALAPGSMTPDPVATRYGFHIIRLDRHIAGRELPFEAVADRIAGYLTESVRRRAVAQYIARLVSAADVTGVDMPGAMEHRVN